MIARMLPKPSPPVGKTGRGDGTARFRKYVTANGFGIVILIAAASRATAIRSELRKQRWPRCVRPSVQVLRELEHIATAQKSK